MLQKRTFYIVGISFIFLGAIIAWNSSQGITGFAIFEQSDISLGYLVGIWLFVAGVVILMVSKQDEEFVKYYHAYPAGEFTPGPLDASRLKHDGFHMAVTQSEAIRALREVNPNVNPNRISLIEVNISRNYNNEIVDNVAGSSSTLYAR